MGWQGQYQAVEVEIEGCPRAGLVLDGFNDVCVFQVKEMIPRVAAAEELWNGLCEKNAQLETFSAGNQQTRNIGAL